MGLLKKIKKFGKKIFKGIKKVFKKVGKFVGKIVGSKWGKVLLSAAAIFTGGVALAAGVKSFATTSGSFLTKFVAGGKAFVGSLVNPVGAFKDLTGVGAQGAQVTQGAKAAAEGAQAAAAAPAELGGVAAGADDALLAGAEGATQAAGAAAPAAQAAQAGSTAAQAVQAAAPAAAQAAGAGASTAGLLGRAAQGAWNFVKSPAGGMVLSQMAQGYAAGRQQEELLDWYNKPWRDERKVSLLREAAGRDIAVPANYHQRAMAVGESVGRDFTPRVRLRREGG